MSEENITGQRSPLIAKDDFRQLFVVMKNEMKKFVRGKKIIVLTLMMGAIAALLAISYLVLMDGDKYISYFLGEELTRWTFMIVILAATLFSATTIVSEFEERTALILFTKPIKKWPIYFGKMLASSIIVGIYLVVYYIVLAIICISGPGNIHGALWTSLGLSLCFMIGCTGVALFISSFAEKGGTASILTFIFIFLILNVISTCVTMAKIDPWWMLDVASNSISSFKDDTHIIYEDAGVMIVWGIVTMILGFIIFRRRDF